MRGGIHGIAWIGALVWVTGFSVQSAWVAFREKSPTKVTLEEYASAQPNLHWLDLQEVELDVASTVGVKDSSGRGYSDIYIPIRPAKPKSVAAVGYDRGVSPSPAPLVVVTKHSSLRKTLYSLEYDVMSREEHARGLREVTRMMQSWTTVTGLIHDNIDREKDGAVLTQLGAKVVPGCKVLEIDAAPSLTFHLVVAGICVCAASFILYLMRDRSE